MFDFAQTVYRLSLVGLVVWSMWQSLWWWLESTRPQSRTPLGMAHYRTAGRKFGAARRACFTETGWTAFQRYWRYQMLFACLVFLLMCTWDIHV
jgi:hypothetical protein